MPRVFDCFCYFNESDVLEIRLEELAPLVDVFVIVESTETHTGEPKGVVFNRLRDRLKSWSDRIRHVVVSDLHDTSAAQKLHPTKRLKNPAWAREWLQRDAIRQGLADAAPEDLVLVSDLDEIPSREGLEAALCDPSVTKSLTFFEHSLHYNRLDWAIPDTTWIGARMLARRWLRSPQQVRLTSATANARDPAPLRDVIHRLRLWRDYGYPLKPRVVRSGWHLSAMGDADAIAFKARQYLDPHDDLESLCDPEVVAGRIGNGMMHWGRTPSSTPISRLPLAVRTNPSRYAHLLGGSSKEELVQ